MSIRGARAAPSGRDLLATRSPDGELDLILPFKPITSCVCVCVRETNKSGIVSLAGKILDLKTWKQKAGMERRMETGGKI